MVKARQRMIMPLAYRGGDYLGKDGKTYWKSAEPIQLIRTRQQNIIIHHPRTKGTVKNAKSPLEAWQYFFPKEKLQKITQIYTSIRIKTNMADIVTLKLLQLKKWRLFLVYCTMQEYSNLRTWMQKNCGTTRALVLKFFALCL